MRWLARSLLVTVTILPAVVWGASQQAATGESLLDIPPSGDYLDSPVFYDLFLSRYSDDSDLPGLREGRVRVQHYDAVDTRDFNWERSTFVDYTWWMQMQEMRFLLPLIASKRETDRAIARDWLIRWFGTHMMEERPQSQWGEPMTWAYRAMVFVYYLRSEQRREHPDEDVVGILLGSILEHQRQLALPAFFDGDSNHGFIDALGLFETTRVFADDAARRLACERLLAMTTSTISAHGFSREHSASYHFVVMRWLDEIVAYLDGCPGLEALLADLRPAAARMAQASYYLQDHDGRLPQIGDTDSVSAGDYGREYRQTHAPDHALTRFDADAGYAVYKGSGKDRRYVVFRIPARRIEMRAHAHMDALSVLFVADGETLLGDGGRYDYGGSGRRAFFQSGWAHNIIVPPPVPGAVSRSLRMAERPRDISDGALTHWSAEQTYGAFRVTRTVRIAGGERGLAVTDSVRAGSSREPIDARRLGAARPATPSVRATVLWNIGPDVRDVEELGAGGGGTWSWRLTTHRGKRFELSVRVQPADSSAVAKVRLVSGEGSPMMGWYSPGNGIARPAPVIALDLVGEAIVETRVDPIRKRAGRR